MNGFWKCPSGYEWFPEVGHPQYHGAIITSLDTGLASLHCSSCTDARHSTVKARIYTPHAVAPNWGVVAKDVRNAYTRGYDDGVAGAEFKPNGN